MNNEFSFESFTPETVFYVLPVFEDVLRGLKERSSTQQPDRWTSAVSDNDRWSPGVAVEEGPEAPPVKKAREG